jgi:CHASE1-domain containing sensor protein
MKWLKENFLLALTIVLLLTVALGGVVDSYRQRQLVKQLQANIVERTEKFEEAMKDGEKMWLSVINPVTKDRDALRKKLSKIEKKTFVKPESVEEEMKRWRNLGYEVAPCK